MPNSEHARDAAVRIVDARHGYTVEHSPHPEIHRREYEREERRLMIIALRREDLLSSYNYPWTTCVLRDAYERLMEVDIDA